MTDNDKSTGSLAKLLKVLIGPAVGVIIVALAVYIYLLASYWAFVPALIAVATLILRTALEDRTLQVELHGYSEYADHVRFRLIQGV